MTIPLNFYVGNNGNPPKVDVICKSLDVFAGFFLLTNNGSWRGNLYHTSVSEELPLA